MLNFKNSKLVIVGSLLLIAVLVALFLPGPTVLEKNSAASQENVKATVTATQTSETTPVATKIPTMQKPKEPGLMAVFAIAGLLAMAYVVLRKRK